MAVPLFHVGDIVRRTDDQTEFEIQGFDAFGYIVDTQGLNHSPSRLELVKAQLPVTIHPETPAEAEDVVNHPSHYKSGKFEAIEVIEAFDLHRDFRLGNAAKYLLRAGKKDDELQDIDKALKYLTRYREHLATGTPSW